jgi:hypothetical protein
MIRFARALFACWVAVIATGANVTHCHAGNSGHTHGIGWACVGCLSGTPLAQTHQHFVLCGVEFGAGSTDPHEPPADGPRAAMSADSLPAPDLGPHALPLEGALAPCGFHDLLAVTGTHTPPAAPCPHFAQPQSPVLRL